MKAWVATLAAVLPPAGIGTVIAIGFVSTLARFGPGRLDRLGREPATVLFMLIHVLLSVPLSVVLIAFRRRFLRLTRPAQVTLAVVAWSAIGVSLLCMMSEMY